MWIDIEISMFRCSLEQTAIGKFDWFFHHIPSTTQLELLASQTATQIALNALTLNANRSVTKACLIVKPIDLMSVDIPVYKTVVGNKESIQEFIETLKS